MPRFPLRRRAVGAGLALACLAGIAGLSASPAMATPLPTLMRDALATHPSLQAKVSLSEAAAAGVKGARWQYFPTPSVSTEYVDAEASDIDYSGDDHVTTLRLQQPLWTGGRLSGGMKKARAGQTLAQADFEAAKLDVAQRVVQDFGEALVAQLKADAFERSASTHARLLDRVRRRAGEGVSPDSDIVMARARLDTAAADLAVARAQRDAALVRLQQWVGREVTRDIFDENSDAAPETEAESIVALVERAEINSPQLARARAQAVVARSEVKLARAAVFPEFYLRAERQFGSYTVPDADPTNRVFVGMSAQFGGGLGSLSAASAANARVRASEQDILGVQRDIAAQVRSQASLVSTSAERRRALANALQSSYELSDAWDRQFLAGRKPWQDVMNAIREISQAESQLADAIGSECVARWRLALLVFGVDAILQQPAVDEDPVDDTAAIQAGDADNAAVPPADASTMPLSPPQAESAP